MKRLNLLLFLVAAVLLSGCENDQLLEEDLNLVQKEEVITQDRLSNFDLNITKGDGMDVSQKSGSVQSIGVEINGMNLKGISNIGSSNDMSLGFIEVYVDYSGVASEYGLPISIVPSGWTMMEFIENYENELSNNFEVIDVKQSFTCDYVYKWIVNENEYFAFIINEQITNPDAENVKKTVKESNDSDIGTFLNYEYIYCF